jgi:membrane-bound lytic murein transglycosylase D
MMLKTRHRRLALSVIFTAITTLASSHDIYFCGERIPVNDKLVAEKMMNIIKRQMNYVNMPSLKQKMDEYMPRVVEYLTAANLPLDFRYLAIIESGFKNEATSSAGAVGFWQLMPGTAKDWGLTVNDVEDDRRDFGKSTVAAFQHIASNYIQIRNKFGISSWVLTAAAYNVGIGNISNAISRQGSNYFSMNLNNETAEYVYKIIAIKELFEYPELYMKNFGYNVFNSNPYSKPGDEKADVSGFRTMRVNINEADGLHPVELKKEKIKEPVEDPNLYNIVHATIKGSYKHFDERMPVTLELDDNLEVGTRFTGKGKPIQAKAWIIGDRVMLDLGYEHRVIVYDNKNEKGIALSKLKKNKPVILKVLKE